MELRLPPGFEAKHGAAGRGHIRQHINEPVRSHSNIADALSQSRHDFGLAGEFPFAVENDAHNEIRIAFPAAHRTDKQIAFPRWEFVAVVHSNVAWIERTGTCDVWHPEIHGV